MSSSITCIQRPPKGSSKSGLLQQVVFKCRFHQVDFRRGVVSEQWSLKAFGCLRQVVSNTGLTVVSWLPVSSFLRVSEVLPSYGC